MVWYPPHRPCGIRYFRALDPWFGILLNALTFLRRIRALDLWFGILLNALTLLHVFVLCFLMVTFEFVRVFAHARPT